MERHHEASISTSKIESERGVDVNALHLVGRHSAVTWLRGGEGRVTWRHSDQQSPRDNFNLLFYITAHYITLHYIALHYTRTYCRFAIHYICKHLDKIRIGYLLSCYGMSQTN